jgi:hypothetical protein
MPGTARTPASLSTEGGAGPGVRILYGKRHPMATKSSGAAVHIAMRPDGEHHCDPVRAIALLNPSAFTAGRTITDLALEIIDDHHQRIVTGNHRGGRGDCASSDGLSPAASCWPRSSTP